MGEQSNDMKLFSVAGDRVWNPSRSLSDTVILVVIQHVSHETWTCQKLPRPQNGAKCSEKAKISEEIDINQLFSVVYIEVSQNLRLNVDTALATLHPP
jgi:hypothetical protein